MSASGGQNFPITTNLKANFVKRSQTKFQKTEPTWKPVNEVKLLYFLGGILLLGLGRIITEERLDYVKNLFRNFFFFFPKAGIFFLENFISLPPHNKNH